MINLQDTGNALLNQAMHASMTRDVHAMSAQNQKAQDKKVRQQKSAERLNRKTTRETLATLLSNDPNAMANVPFEKAQKFLQKAVDAKLRARELFKQQQQLLRSKAYIKAHGDTTDALEALKSAHNDSISRIDKDFSKQIAKLGKKKGENK